MQKLPIREIAEQRGLTEHTIINHIAHLVMVGEKLDLGHFMPSAEHLTKIKAAFQDSGSLILLTPVWELLGEEYSYEELRLVLICLRQKQDLVRSDRIRI